MQTVKLISGYEWTVPADWSNINVVQCVGGGAPGLVLGGGGGAFASVANLAFTPGQNVRFHVGYNNGSVYGATFFDGSGVGNALVVAATANGVTGGQAAYSKGQIVFSGGYVGPHIYGAGAAGPNNAGGAPSNERGGQSGGYPGGAGGTDSAGYPYGGGGSKGCNGFSGVVRITYASVIRTNLQIQLGAPSGSADIYPAWNFGPGNMFLFADDDAGIRFGPWNTPPVPIAVAKDPFDVQDMLFDFSGLLAGGDLIVEIFGVVISSADVVVNERAILPGAAGAAQAVGVQLAGGTAGQRYTVTVQIQTFVGLKISRSIILPVQAR